MDSMETRRNAIVAWINQRGSVSFAELKEKFPMVSEMTLRTDLRSLDSDGRILRIHGGARSIGALKSTLIKDDFINNRSILNVPAKEIIAQKAAALLRPEEAIFIDSGSTATMMAAAIEDGSRLIYTSGLDCATELARLEKARIYLPGGVLNRYSHSVCGICAIREIERINFCQAFIGVTGFSYENGFSCSIDDEARLKKAAINNAREVILLMDSSKLCRHSTYTFCQIADVDIIVSDGHLPEDFLSICHDEGVKVL